MAELPLFVRIIPENLREAKGKVQEQMSDVQTTGTRRGAGTGAKGGQAGGAGQGIMGMVGQIGAMAGAVMFIANMIAGLKPIMNMLKMLTKITQLFILPFIMMLSRLLTPILTQVLKLMPLWLDFWKDPVGNLIDMAKWLAKQIGSFFSRLPGMIWSFLSNIPSMIGDYITDLPGEIATAIEKFLTPEGKEKGTTENISRGLGAGIFPPFGAMMGLEDIFNAFTGGNGKGGETTINNNVNLQGMSGEEVKKYLQSIFGE